MPPNTTWVLTSRSPDTPAPASTMMMTSAAGERHVSLRQRRRLAMMGLRDGGWVGGDGGGCRPRPARSVLDHDWLLLLLLLLLTEVEEVLALLGRGGL